ncbi:MAG: hypothetical protein ACRDOI_37685 [Trebonia sp.]
MRKTLSGASLAAFLALSAVACASGGAGGGNGGGASGALDPSSDATTSASGAGIAAPSAAANGPRSFVFPAGVQVQFQTPLPASGTQRAAMIGYENYVDSLWSAVSSQGSDTAYRQYMGGNALTFANGLIAEFKSGDYQLSGTIVYFDISVPQSFYGSGAVVQSCVDASGLYMVNAETGKTGKTVFDSSYQHYQEQAAVGKSTAGYWTVSHTENSPASGGDSTGVCV